MDTRVQEALVPEKHRTYVERLALPPAGLGIRLFAVAVTLAALAVGFLVLGWSGPAWAQSASDCEATDLGTLSNEAGTDLTADGRWTTQDCDSIFRPSSDAHTYTFEVSEAGRIRIDLTSAEADSFLYLLAEDGSRLADNDDGGAGLDARIERDLTPAVYTVEATTVGGRSRGAADFRLTIGRVTGCDPVHLGSLEPGASLTATGSWTLDTCGSMFVVEHPAHGYVFDLPQGGRVRLDLMSENGDPVMSLVSTTAGLIAANDDGGERRNSRIGRYLQPGTYLVEATTYLERDYQPLMADFTLVIQLVDEAASQDSFLLKIEDVHTPERVVAGQPFDVHYRVGNLGGGDLADIGGKAVVYVVGPRVYEYTDPIESSEGRWESGVSYHTGAQTANASSVEIREVAPFEVTLRSPGPSWVFVGIVTDDEDGEERGFHGQWQNVMVLSGTTFAAANVSVDGTEYTVEAEADIDGQVTTTVSPVADPEADVEDAPRAKAIFAAGVRSRLLDGLFERPEIAGLPITGTSTDVDVASPTSDALLARFADRFTDEIDASGLPDALAAQEALSPVAIEDLILGTAGSASAEYFALAESWSALQESVDSGEPLSFAEAIALYSELAYAERVISPIAEAGRVVEAARAAESGWQDAGVQEMVDKLEQRTTCRNPGRGLREVLSDTEDLDAMLRLDAEMREALPVYGPAVDAVLCAVADADGDNSLFLAGLGVDDNSEILELFGHEQTSATPTPEPPHRLRIIARLNEDGRIEHGVELSDGERVLPTRRHLSPDAPAGEWQTSSDVEVDETPIGRIRTRRLDDGRVELGFLDAGGGIVTPEIRYLSADMPSGVWLRSAEVEVTKEPVLE